MRISLVGGGYVGLVTAACFADLGHDVSIIDHGPAKVKAINAKKPPIYEEGLENRFRRHEMLGDRLKMELEGFGFKLFAQEGYRLPMLTSVALPDWMDDAKTRSRLLNEYNIEVGAGLGWLKGKIWRVGLMGETCKLRYIHCLVGALREILA
jgi:alanine-glyoxylate transaminase/serine-glyoxylate transaminase/serine-pyruvate transaminase